MYCIAQLLIWYNNLKRLDNTSDTIMHPNLPIVASFPLEAAMTYCIIIMQSVSIEVRMRRGNFVLIWRRGVTFTGMFQTKLGYISVII